MIDTRFITFLTVARIKNFTKAGQLLNLTQPAVSQQIKYLENYYEVQLIKKQGKQICLTEEGEILLKYIKEMEKMSRSLEREIKNKSAIVKRYQVGATITIGGYVLPTLLGRYKEVHKNIDVILQVHNTEEVIKKMLEREVHLAVVEGPFDKQKLQYKKMKSDELVLAVSPKHEFAKREEVSLEEVIKGKLILRERGSGTRKIFENYIVAMGFDLEEINVYMELGSIDAIKLIVESNLGYTVISKEALKREIELGTIQIVPIKNVRFYRDFNFVYLEEVEREFRESFIDFCCSEIETIG